MTLALLSHPRLALGLAVLCGLVALPLGARMTAYEPFVCPGSSMFPAIQRGDRFVAERVEPRDLHRGDVVLMRNPTDSAGVVVKRLVALPGDQVWIHDGAVILNDQPVEQCPLGRMELVPGVSGDAYLEVLDGNPYVTLLFDGMGAGDRCVDGPCRIPEGEVFVVGDNRDDSVDSRTWGSLSLRDLLGRARWGTTPSVPPHLAESYARCLAAR